MAGSSQQNSIADLPAMSLVYKCLSACLLGIKKIFEQLFFKKVILRNHFLFSNIFLK